MKTELIPYGYIHVDATVKYASALWKAEEVRSLSLSRRKRNFFTYQKEKAEPFAYFAVWGHCRQTWYYLTRMNSPNEKLQILDSRLIYMATVEARRHRDLLVRLGATIGRRNNKLANMFYKLKNFVRDVTSLAARIFGDNPEDPSTYWSTLRDFFVQ